jgi:REP element-mobilizing transposase RayT
LAYWRLFYHIVWATKGRAHLITADLEPKLHGYLRGKIISLGGVVHAVGGIEDHIHVAASIPPKFAVATFVGQLKGASSHWVNHLTDYEGALYWQDGYGVFSFGERALPRVVAYVLNQRQHHAAGDLWAGLERIEEADMGV